MSFATRLKQAREKSGLTQNQLALRLKVTKSAVSNYENEVSTPNDAILLRLFSALSVEPNFLFQDSYIASQQQDIIQIKKKKNRL